MVPFGVVKVWALGDWKYMSVWYPQRCLLFVAAAAAVLKLQSGVDLGEIHNEKYMTQKLGLFGVSKDG